MNIQVITWIIHLKGEVRGNVLSHLVINGVSGTSGDYKIHTKCLTGADNVDKTIRYIHVFITEGCVVINQHKDCWQRVLT